MSTWSDIHHDDAAGDVLSFAVCRHSPTVLQLKQQSIKGMARHYQDKVRQALLDNVNTVHIQALYTTEVSSMDTILLLMSIA